PNQTKPNQTKPNQTKPNQTNRRRQSTYGPAQGQRSRTNNITRMPATLPADQEQKSVADIKSTLRKSK
ncbi:hypothetical protein, partial [Paraburkholderia azotifigens]|uniref:hypothetical protein n=1 Tax=Paraburkholderia azotifigens TaxID=2057004 RepID=UPI0038B736D3